ncbi:MAG: tetratricopeptide repeat protein, partial [Chrysiogenales bacterium]
MIHHNSPVRFNKAVQLEKQGRYDEALNEYTALLRSDPDFRSAYVNLGSLYSRLNKLSEAMKCYHAALSLGQDFITHFNIGCIHYKIGENSQALSHLMRSSEMNDSFFLSLLVSGLCHSRLNDLGRAEKSFLRVLAHRPDNRVALTAMAIIYYNTARFIQALKLLNTILTLDDENIALRELKSDILLKSGRIDESAEVVKEISKRADGYKYFEEFIKSIPIETFSDRYGTIEDKIDSLQEKRHEDARSLVALSLCHLLKG